MSGITRNDTLMRDFPESSGPMAAWSHVEAVPNVKEALAQLRSQFSTRDTCCVQHRI